MNRKAEAARSDREENRKRHKRRFLPFSVSYLFHSDLAAGARQIEKRRRSKKGHNI